MKIKKIGAETILMSMFLPWAVWVTITVFNSKEVSAVQENKYENIIGILKEIKLDIKEMKSNSLLKEITNHDSKE
jgi:hypothetical protein